MYMYSTICAVLIVPNLSTVGKNLFSFLFDLSVWFEGIEAECCQRARPYIKMMVCKPRKSQHSGREGLVQV